MIDHGNQNRYYGILSKIDLWADLESRRCKSLHYKFARRLSGLSQSVIPERIKYTETRGCKYYSEVWIEDGKKKTRYLGKSDHPFVRDAQERRFLAKAVSELDGHVARLRTFTNTFGIFDEREINEKLPRAYRLSDDALSKVAGLTEEERWYAVASKKKADDFKKLSQNDYYLAQFKHTAKDGTVTRSKSEMSIANALFDRGIKYVYEYPLKISGLPVHPDFSFYSYSRGKVLYWEHAGMMGDDYYRKDFADRLDLYINAGYVPCVDVVFTFDTTGGDLDSRTIEAIIDEYM